MNSNNRADLSNRSILLLALLFALVAAITWLWPGLPRPGAAPAQLAAAAGSLLLLAPLLFLIMKRSGLSANPPTWFLLHLLASLVGACLILYHSAAGDWLTPPGLVLLLLLLLIAQGSLLRALISSGFSLLFARGSIAQGFAQPQNLDKAVLQQLIDNKTSLLLRLDASADEALFSPALKHWLRHPWLSLGYQRLAWREAQQVGARQSAGPALGWSRRIHMLVALLFYLGLGAHVVVVLFFAGYAAGDGPVDWWYITDWGR